MMKIRRDSFQQPLIYMYDPCHTLMPLQIYADGDRRNIMGPSSVKLWAGLGGDVKVRDDFHSHVIEALQGRTILC